MKTNLIKTNNSKQTQEFALNFAKDLKGGDILCLYGDLGSGKTTFVQGLARGLGINRRIISPTFIIVRHYMVKPKTHNFKTFCHIDLYRTGEKSDLLGLGINEIIEDKNNIVAVEWAEKLGDILPQKRIELYFKYIDENKREISFQKYE
jgi:tRNA threonylcarbamoyladenosine biosynthesis protein TsaE